MWIGAEIEPIGCAARHNQPFYSFTTLLSLNLATYSKMVDAIKDHENLTK